MAPSTSVAVILEVTRGARSLANHTKWAQVALLALLLLPAIALLSEGGKTTGEVQCIESERQALLKFKHGLEDYDNTLSSWPSSDKDCCKWRGIKCHNRTNHVIVLHLGSSNERQSDDSDADEYKCLEDFTSILRGFMAVPLMSACTRVFDGLVLGTKGDPVVYTDTSVKLDRQIIVSPFVHAKQRFIPIKCGIEVLK
ncbi:hypothetical protein FNV43_RR26830 [Rhamnella rubrinervis]|uniref:Leucine-rich repeat-containing N-terminal plant-type domain-containing protein n=1 Tax=Rhamnella rubrinervis TaxID=2594499 RepID=A0A8K0DNR9_9ROSA|nr:hypothetical protein FNV43_RR26830 [Rhamnella rubrinervis]